MTRPVQLRGFTLIELILVMVIISITLALASPSLRGWGQGQKLRNAADTFLAATGYARAQAVATATPFAVEIDAAANTFVVQSVAADNTRTPAASDFGQTVTLPEAYTIRLVSGGGVLTPAAGTTATDGSPTASGTTATGAVSILFYPDARGTPAVVELKAPNGDVITLSSESPADPFRRVEAVK